MTLPLHRWFQKLFFLGLILLTAACRDNITGTPSAVPAPAAAPLKIGIAEPAYRIGEIIESQQSQLGGDSSIQIITGSNHTLLEDLADGDLDAAVSPFPDPIAAIWTNPIAMDGLVFVLHPENPSQSMSLKDLRRIFSGSATTWDDLANWETQILPVVPETESGIFELFQERVMGEHSMSGASRIIFDSRKSGEAAAADNGAIVLAAMSAGGSGKLAAVEGVDPTPATLADQSYPLTFPLYWTSLEEPRGRLRELLAWLQSEEGQELIGEYYGRVR